jgi:hypothetical protein
MKPIFRVASAFAVMLAATNAVAATHTFSANLTGAQEVPPTGSPATGQCTVTLDDVTGAVTVSGTFAGLSTPASAAHIHGLAGPGVPAGVLIPLTVPSATSGSITGGGTLTGANIAGMIAGQTYVNVHSTMFSGGEIRGQILASAPATNPWSLVILSASLALAGGILLVRRRAAAL